MESTFWSNTIWYLLLAVSTLIGLIFVLFKTKNRKHVIALFLIISGMTFCVEATIFCFLKSYDYYPMILPHSRIEDGLMGNLFSQFSLASTAVLIAAFNLDYYWFLIFAMMYGIIEELFLMLGLYSHNWYQTWMTMLGVTVLFGITKLLYKHNSIYTLHKARYFLMFFGLYTIHMPTIYWVPILSGFISLNTNLFPDPMNSYAFISLANLFFLSISCMFIYFSKAKWLLKSMLTLVLYAVLYLAYKANWFYAKEGWFLIFATIDIWGMYLCIYIMDKLMTRLA